LAGPIFAFLFEDLLFVQKMWGFEHGLLGEIFEGDFVSFLGTGKEVVVTKKTGSCECFEGRYCWGIIKTLLD
jgi:hypothetical protein